MDSPARLPKNVSFRASSFADGTESADADLVEIAQEDSAGEELQAGLSGFERETSSSTSEDEVRLDHKRTVNINIADGTGSAALYQRPRWSTRILTSGAFLIFNVVLITLNVLWVGIQADGTVMYEQGVIGNLRTYYIIESLFTGLFLVELLIRLLHFARWQIWRDALLLMDVVVILVPALEIWVWRPLNPEASHVGVTIVTLFRLCRVARGIMMLASITWFRPLFLSAISLKHSLSPLLAMFMYLAIMIFTASVVLCQLLGPSSSLSASFPSVISVRFSSVAFTCLTLVESFLGGVEWGPEVSDVLLSSPSTQIPGMIFFVFLALGGLLWLNIVAGVFVQQVDRSFELTYVTKFKDPEQKALTQDLLKDFVQSLNDMDRQNTGAVSFRDISAVLPHHLEQLSDVGVGLPEAKKIFHELDATSTGYVSIPLFVSRIEDYLKYKPIEVLIFENQQFRLLQLVKKLSKRNKKTFNKVSQSLEIMANNLAQAFEGERQMPEMVQEQFERQRQRVRESGVVSTADAARQLDEEIMSNDLSPRPVARNFTGRASRPLACSPNFVMDMWKESLLERRPEVKELVRSSIRVTDL